MDIPTWRSACRREKCSLLRCLQQSPSVLPRWHKAAAEVAEPEVAEREVVVPVAPVVERLEVPVVLAEQRAQLAEQRREPPMRVRRLAAA
jgi:hypothetical protein